MGEFTTSSSVRRIAAVVILVPGAALLWLSVQAAQDAGVAKRQKMAFLPARIGHGIRRLSSWTLLSLIQMIKAPRPMPGVYAGKNFSRKIEAKFDVALAQKMLGDHADTFDKKRKPTSGRSATMWTPLQRGVPQWAYTPYYPGGAVQGKATDSTMAKEMRLSARVGHPCREDFIAKTFLAAHPEYAWQEPYLRDMKAGPWAVFTSGETPVHVS